MHCRCGWTAKPCRNKEFIHTLDESMVRKLCIRSLRRGIGSMNYIHGLLIMEDDLEDESLNSSDITPTPGTSTEEQLTNMEGTPGPIPPSGSSTIPWCKCVMCQIMPQDIENKCCSQRRCVTIHNRFKDVCAKIFQPCNFS
ncbi:uncharacterized protein LOC144649373 [Oculina patagonica]